jgi:TrmH family RNA methyltransferase
MTVTINSPHNKRLKKIIDLKKSSYRKKFNLFLLEGKRELERAVLSGFIVESIFLCSDLTGINQLNGIEKEKIFNLDKKNFSKISFRENPDGFLGILQKKNYLLNYLQPTINSFYLIIESIEKPGNLGAILRTAEAAGVDAVIINDEKTDIYNPNVIRSSQGSLFSIKTVISSKEITMQWLKKNKIVSFAATPHTHVDYLACDYNYPLAIVMGSENIGLSHEWLNFADKKIKITMRGIADSLNVSVATGIILFEVLRQRQKI